LTRTSPDPPEEIVTGQLRLDRIASKPVRDVLRQAARMAAHGDTVCILNRAGARIGALVSVERAEFSREITSARFSRALPVASGSAK
jgi:hypothetical protein